MGAFFKPSEEPGVKRAKRSGATLIPGSSDGTLCAAIAEQMSAVARSLWRKTLSLSPPCGWVHFKLPKWVKSKLALAASQIWEYFELSSSTMQAKSKQIRDLLGMYPMDPEWSTPSMIDQNPLVWMLEINGLIIDVRHAPREIQEAAFRQGLIPYIPEA